MSRRWRCSITLQVKGIRHCPNYAVGWGAPIRPRLLGDTVFIRSFAVIAARIVFAAFAIFSFSAPAAAQFLTFVSATGVDTRPCTVQAQPCKTLQRAVNVTGGGGTIRLLSDLLGQNATIAKSLIVEGGGKSVTGTITVNGASAVVTLRGLNLTGRGVVANGIRILSAAAVHIEDSTVERYTIDGIKFIATTPTKLFISGTAVRANASDGLYADDLNAQVVIQNSNFDQNGHTGLFLRVAKANVTGSSASGNVLHGFALTSTAVKITETRADHNGGDGFAVRAGSVILNSAEANSNGANGLHVEAGLPSATVMSDCVFIGAGGAAFGVRNEPGGFVLSRQNNTVSDYSGTLPSSFAAF